VDIVDKATRSRMMAGISGKNSKPELLIRKALHRMGYRYRIHYTGLPGKPDMVFPMYHAIILINGCFWHRHNCHLFKWPATRKDFWHKKILASMARDERNLAYYKKLGWKVLVIWECSIKGKTRINVNEVVKLTVDWLRNEKQSFEITGRPVKP